VKRSTRRLFRDYSLTIVLAVSVALGVRTFLLEAYQVPGSAMKPSLLAGDTLFAAKWSFQLQHHSLPDRGDVIVYTAPSELDSTKRLNFIRRVIGHPGDEVRIENGIVILNGKPLAADPGPVNIPANPCSSETLPSGRTYEICRDTPVMENFGPEIIPDHSVFVLGDQRTASEMKKRKPWAMVPLSSIQGKGFYIWLSIEPVPHFGQGGSWFPHFRLNRMFRRVK